MICRIYNTNIARVQYTDMYIHYVLVDLPIEILGLTFDVSRQISVI